MEIWKCMYTQNCKLGYNRLCMTESKSYKEIRHMVNVMDTDEHLSVKGLLSQLLGVLVTHSLQLSAPSGIVLSTVILSKATPLSEKPTN